MKLILAVLTLCTPGCTAFDNYDRTYSLSVSDGKQSVAIGATFHPRTLPKPGGLVK